MFKKLVIAGAIVAAATGSAVAQSAVTVYGVMDAGVIAANKAGSAVSDGYFFTSGIDQTSRLGFRATESIDNGLHAGANYEMQVDAGNGSQGLGSSSGSANAVFARAANVFLHSNSLGRVTLGRQSNANWGIIGAFDGRRMSNFGSITNFISDGSSFGGTSTAKTGLSSFTGGPYVSNSVRYDTPKFAGFTGTYARNFGNVSGDESKSSADTFNIMYDNNGKVFAGVAYYITRNSSGADSGETKFAGVGYRATQSLTLMTSYFDIQNPNGAGAANTKFDIISVGARYQVAPKVEITANHYMMDDKVTADSGTDLTSVGATYSLSKRTLVYLMGSRAKNTGTAGISAYGGGGSNLNSLGNTTHALGAAGVTQTAYALGLRHAF